MKVLITGGNGYIAKSLIKNLQHKYSITAISRKDFDLTVSDAVNDYFKDKYFDVVIHTAIVGGSRLKEDNDTILRQNLDMYYNLMNNKEHFKRFISFGSGAELVWPTTPYGYSKRIIAESMLHREYCLNIRIFAVFDENELDRRFIKSNILRYINHQDMIVHENKYMDFFYMEDLIKLVDYYLEKNNWLYNQVDCGYNVSHTLTEIATIINQLDRHKVKIVVGDSFEKAYTGNYIGHPIQLIGLEEGIRKTYNLLKNEH